MCAFARFTAPAVYAILSAARQIPPPARILVIDNAETPAAAGRVALGQTKLSVPLAYIHAPARNISVVRNAALDGGHRRMACLSR